MRDLTVTEVHILYEVATRMPDTIKGVFAEAGMAQAEKEAIEEREEKAIAEGTLRPMLKSVLRIETLRVQE